MVVAVSAGGGPRRDPKSLSETFSERDFRLAGGPTTYRKWLGWPRSGSASTGMTPDAGPEPLTKPPASDISLSERSKTAHIAACKRALSGGTFEGRDESIFEKTPLCQPPETPKGTSYIGPDMIRALLIHATFLAYGANPRYFWPLWGSRTGPPGRHELILGSTHTVSAPCD